MLTRCIFKIRQLRRSISSLKWLFFMSVYQLVLPADQTSFSVEPSSKLCPWLHDLPLQDCVPDNILTIFWPHPRQPNALGSALVRGIYRRGLSNLSFRCLVPVEVSSPVHNHVRRIFVSSDMIDKVDTNAPGPLIIQVPMQA